MRPPFSRNFAAYTLSGNPGNFSAIRVTTIDLTEENAVIFPHVPAIDITTGDYAISFWVQILEQPPLGSNMLLWQKASVGAANSDANYVNLISSTPGVVDNCEYSVTVTGPASVTDTTDVSAIDFTDWTNIVVRKNSSGISTWVNGSQIGSGVATALPLLSDPTSFYTLFYDPVASSDPLLTCDIRMADFRFYDGTLSNANIANLAAFVDVTTNLSTRVKFNNNCLDSVGSMDGTKGANVQYCPGPPGLPE